MNIGRAAEASGLSADTIRFYERKGVLPRAPRGENDYRDYSEEHVAVMRFAHGLRDLGLSLDEIRAIVAVAHDGVCGDIRSAMLDTARNAMRVVDERLTQLERGKRELTRLVRGLERMKPRDERVPGVTACQCAALVR